MELNFDGFVRIYVLASIRYSEHKILHLSSEDYRSKIRVQTHISIVRNVFGWNLHSKIKSCKFGLNKDNMLLCGSKCDRIVSKVVLNQKCANEHLHSKTHLVVGVQEYTLA